MPRCSIAFASSGCSFTSGVDDRFGNLVLIAENIGQLSVLPLRPDMVAGRTVDQLGGDAHPAAAPCGRFPQHMMNAQPLGDVAHVDSPPFNVKAVLPPVTDSADIFDRSV